MKKRKKFKIIILILIILIIVGIAYLILSKKVYKDDDFDKLKSLNYSKEAIELIKKNNIQKKVIENDYSKTLEVSLTKNEFEKENLDLYLNTKYINKDDYIPTLNKLSSLGYDKPEIELIISTINYDDLDKLTSYTYIDNLKDYLKFKNFRIDNMERYINYRDKNKNLNFENIISYVNMDLDKKPYENPKIIEDTDSKLMLVNKHNKLPDNFKAKDLEQIDAKYSIRDSLLNKEAKKQFELLCSDAKSIGLNIRALSSYRTNTYQESLYNDYVKRNGVKEADTYSARPGFSEHETGLSLDVIGGNASYTDFKTTDEYTWAKNNIHNYGFIIRYPKDKENITQYMFEAWHFRYVGKEAAKYIYENNLCLEEYHDLVLKK